MRRRETRERAYRYLLSWIILFATLFTSCINDDVEPTSPTRNKETLVKLVMHMPKLSQPDANTYALTPVDENKIETIDILAFAANKDDASKLEFRYSFQASGSNIVNAGGTDQSTKQFVATLIIDDAPQTLVILANSRSEVEALGKIEKGTEKNELLSKLLSVHTGAWNVTSSDNFKPFPMWGEVSNVSITDLTKELDAIAMLRGVARVDVILAGNALSQNQFRLKEIQVYNSKTSGRIVPVAKNITNDKATAPSLPDELTNNPTNLIYGVPEGQSTAFEQEIYLYEAPAGSSSARLDATCLIIGGIYGADNNTTTYYRIDFVDNKATENYFPVLRNYKYRFLISEVSGKGYDTVDEAYRAKPLNMKAAIKIWDEGQVGDILFNDDYYLSFDPGREYEYDPAGSTQVVNITTDYEPGFKFLKYTQINSSGEEEPMQTATSWISMNKELNVNYGTQEETIPVGITVGKNPAATDREGYIYVKSGRIETRIKITQGAGSDIRIVDKNDADITKLIFVAAADIAPKAQDFSVKWTPEASVVTISNTPGSTEFPSGTTGIPADGSSLTDGTGNHLYTVAPIKIEAYYLLLDPFLVRSAKLEFSIDNGKYKNSKSITLEQFVPSVQTNQKTGFYLTNGSTYNFEVLSNSTWKIKSVTPSIANLLNLQGSDNLKPNVSGGDATVAGTGTILTFTVANNTSATSITGTVTIVFECTDPTRPFADTTVVLSVGSQYYPSAHKGWASTNIYWDDVNKKLTFEDIDRNWKLQYQGVFFQWGSLWGISPEGSWSNNSTIIYTPDGRSGTLTGLDNTKTSWTSIPHVTSSPTNVPPAGGNARGRNYLYEITNAENGAKGIGDICKYLTDKAPGGLIYGKRWRMPTIAEYDPSTQYSPWYKSFDTPTVTADGMAKIGYGRIKVDITSPFLTASGYRTATGTLSGTVITQGYYWTGTPYNSTNAYRLYFNNDTNDTSPGKTTGYNTYPTAMPVRCVVE